MTPVIHECEHWLLLAVELPARPTAARMRTWRQLRRIGALPLKSGVYALPEAPQQREDFEWLLTEVRAAGGEGILIRGTPLDSAVGTRLVESVRKDREEQFDALRKEAEALGRSRRRSSPARRSRTARKVLALSERLQHIEALDFFGSDGRAEARAAIEALRTQEDAVMSRAPAVEILKTSAFQRRIWVTRRRPGIDRFASAWLIRRFVDSRARFAFADSLEEAARAHPRALPFDMFGAEFGHHGGACTFETLAHRFDLQDAGVQALERIVHALDLKDDAPVPFDAAVLGRIVDGLRALHANDAALLDRGMEVIEALYRSLNSPAPSRPAPAPPRRVQTTRRAVRR